MIKHLNLAMVARPAKAIREMWNKALSWPPLPSLLFFSIFLSLPPVLMCSLCLLASVCVRGELWGKGKEERARESSCPSLSTSAFSNAPRSMSLCVSREESGGGGEGKIHAAVRKCGFQCIDAIQFSILCCWQRFSVCMHACVCALLHVCIQPEWQSCLKRAHKSRKRQLC